MATETGVSVLDDGRPVVGVANRGVGGFEAVVGALAALTVAVHAIAPAVGGGWLWGADAYRFLDPLRVTCAIAAATLAGFATRWALRATRFAKPVQRSIHPWAAAVASGAAVASVLCAFRIRHVLLGDGIPITARVPGHAGLHPREPLASLVHDGLYHLFAGWFAGRSHADVVWGCVAIGSVIAGVAFYFVAKALVRELLRATPSAGDDRGLTIPLLTVVLAQGYVQLFFGYVETYSFSVVAWALYVLLGLRFVRGVGSVALPLTALVLAFAFHFSAVILLPSALVLVLAGWRSARRRAMIRDLAALVLGVAAFTAWLALGPPRFPVLSRLRDMISSGRASADYLASAAHVRDFLNEHVLLGPWGLFLFVPAAIAMVWRREAHGARGFLVVAGGFAAVACWLAPDLPMGYARDWDLYAPLGVTLSASALGLTLARVREPGARGRIVTVLAGVAVFHTLPWVLLNTSEPRSLERFKTLPLGFGRTENTVAAWHANRGEYEQAKEWLQRSLAANPTNTRAMDLYGRIAFEQDRPELAIRAYLVAVALRPDKPDFREQLQLAVRAGGTQRAFEELDSLLARDPSHGALWLERALLHRLRGERAAAEAAERRALELAPDLATLAPEFDPSR